MGRKSLVKDKKAIIVGLQSVGLILLVFLLFSSLSFDMGDWPSRFVYPYNEPPANWCGSIGAFCAYFLFYYIGPGVFVLLISGIFYLGFKIAKKEIDQLWLRYVGLGVMTIAASCSYYFFWPHSYYTFPQGSGGVLGIGITNFLKSHFALLGTFLLLTACWVVGSVLLADRLVMKTLTWTGFAIKKIFGVASPAWAAAREHSQVMSEIWKKLSAKQHVVQAENQVLERDRDIELKITSSSPVPPPETVVEQAEAVEAEEEAAVPGPSDAAQAILEQKPAVKKLPIPIKQPAPFVCESYKGYEPPPVDLLDEPEYGYSAIQNKVVKTKASSLEKLLSEFNINARVVSAETGPVVTMFELELAAGVKVSQISSLSNDVARALEVGAVRVVAPLPGKHTIGIEVPNSEKEKVRIKDLMRLAGDKPSRMAIPLFLGKDSSGEALVSDLAAMPHLLIAGTTGSGKSFCINSIITSILMTKRPDEVKMILIDPKMVEMTVFSNVPHLMSPIVTETKRAVQILEWATVKMDERYALLAEAKVKNISGYNSLSLDEIVERFNPSTPEEEAKIPKKLPYIVIVIDELADLMMTASKEIEAFIVRLAQKSRAVGIHIVLATQRPQATVVTGLIKSNMPCRIGFRVAARMDSRIILDQNGAETLLGQGDMLFLKPGSSDLSRAQGTYLDDNELRRIVKHLKDVGEPQFHPELTQLGRIDPGMMEKDDLFDESVRIVLETKRGSVSLLQRRLSIGYARASRIIEMMAATGILGEYKGSQAREVMVTLEEYEEMRKNMDFSAAPQPAGETLQQSDDADADSEQPQPAYVSEGQKGYAAIEDEVENQ